MATWQIQEAKNKLSELIDRAISDGPQVITRHGVEIAVVMPVAGYKKLIAPQLRLGDFLLASPLRHSDLQLDRDKTMVLRDADI